MQLYFRSISNFRKCDIKTSRNDNSRRIQCFHWMHETVSNGLRNIQAFDSSHNVKSPFYAGTYFSFFLFYETRLRSSGYKRMQIAGWHRVPKLRAQDYTLRDEIPGHKKEGSKGRWSERERERESKETELWIAIWLILITRHVYQNLGTWTLPRSVRRLSLPTWHECILLCPPWARKRKAVPRSFLKGAGERRDESLKNLINGTPVI